MNWNHLTMNWNHFRNHSPNHSLTHSPIHHHPSAAESTPHPPQTSNIATHNYSHSLLLRSPAGTAATASPATPHIPHFFPPPPLAASATAIGRSDYAASYSANPVCNALFSPTRAQYPRINALHKLRFFRQGSCRKGQLDPFLHVPCK